MNKKGEIKWNGKVKWNLRKVKQRQWVGKKSRTLTVLGPLVKVTLSYVKFKGICVLGVSRAARAGAPYVTVRRMEWPSVKKRPAAGVAPSGRNLASLDPGPLAPVSPLVDHCALLQYDEGDPRKPGKFFVETQGTAWKVTVKDQDTCTQFTTVGATLWAALEAAALLLACDDAPWEPDVWALEKAKKNKK